jgi:hypothetical protein
MDFELTGDPLIGDAPIDPETEHSGSGTFLAILSLLLVISGTVLLTNPKLVAHFKSKIKTT